MANNYAICCVNCNKPLSDEDEIFGTSCGHLYHFPCISSIHGKSPKCIHCEAYKPMMFRMYLKFVDSPVTSQFHGLYNKLTEHEKINALLNSSNHAARQTIQQHEEEIERLKNALHANVAVERELRDRIETLEQLNKYLSTNQDNCIKKQQPNNNYNKGNNEVGNHYNGKQVESESNTFSTGIGYKKPLNDGRNDREDVAANASGIQNPIANEKTRRNTVVIRNFKSSDLSMDNALANVIGLAEKMNMSLAPDDIKHVLVLSEGQHFVTYIVYFCTKQMKDQFLQKIHILKECPETKFLEII